MKKNNIIKIVIIVVVALIFIFFGYKGFMFYRYTIERPDNVEDVVKGLKNQSTMTIKKNVLEESEYVTVGQYKVKNILDGYKEDEDSSKHVKIYRKEVDGKNYAIQFALDLNDYQVVDAFTNDVNLYYGEGNLGFLKGDIMSADRKGFLEKTNIKNDIDFYKYAADNYFIESNLFTDTKTLKQNYAYNVITSLSVPQIDGWIILEGDITGYIMLVGTNKDTPVYQISILEDDKSYHITTSDPRFKDESFLKDFVGSIEIIK